MGVTASRWPSGSTIANPYLSIKHQAARTMLAISGVGPILGRDVGYHGLSREHFNRAHADPLTIMRGRFPH